MVSVVNSPVELILTFAIAVCDSCNVNEKYTLDNARDLKQPSMDSEDNRSD